jgi:hypothetical protein
MHRDEGKSPEGGGSLISKRRFIGMSQKWDAINSILQQKDHFHVQDQSATSIDAISTTNGSVVIARNNGSVHLRIEYLGETMPKEATSLISGLKEI